MRDFGVVVIGRNEGLRLRACFEVLVKFDCPIVYVDSASTDESVALAKSLDVDAVELDMSLAFSAARARNEGFYFLITAHPEIQFVQFLDGDCILNQEWPEAAVRFLFANPDYAVVCGRRRERFLDQSIYNRVIDLEWNTPVGEARSCGGDSMIRISAFREVGGYDPKCVAGEEPELCYRLRQSGWRIIRLDAEMTLHDSAMTRLTQWWRRSMRGGYGSIAVYARCSGDAPRPYAHQIKSCRTWVVGWPALVFICGLFGYWAGAWIGLFAGLLLAFGLLPMQVARIAWKKWKKGVPLMESLAYGYLIMISKPAEFIGQVRYFAEKIQGKSQTIIEHKN
jgi:GT2 family glycosyltransferase